MVFSYPVVLTPDDNDTVMATFVDLPGATYGNDEADALANAVDLLETVMMGYIMDRKEVPAPSNVERRATVSPTLRGALKLAVYQAMCARGWRKSDLAREMALNPRQIDRLLDLHHASTIAQLEQALAACGRKATIVTMDLAA